MNVFKSMKKNPEEHPKQEHHSKNVTGHEAHSEPGPAQGEESAKSVTLTKKEYDALIATVQELEGLKDKMLRTAADFENSKKRVMRERDEYVRFAQEALIRDLIPLLDNFERALSHGGDIQDPKLKGVITGIQMVFKQMSELLKNQGLARLETLGKKFDPHWHESVGFVHEPGEEDQIVQEVEAGYTLHGKLLRAAKVRVRGHAKPTSEEKQEEIT